MNPRPGDALPAPGDTFADKYTIVRVVGEGGVGVVFEAEHQRLKQRVAIKILRSEASHSAEWLVRFEREARAAAEIHGNNVAKVFDVDSLPDGTPYMVMELLAGHDLAAELALRKRLPVAEAVGYMREACAAMAEAHALGIVHRDLTPRNLFLAEGGPRRTLKVLDFGISKVIDDRSNVTATDAAFGTPNYVSPEQIRSTSQVDTRTDIWSLGVILFEMLAGALPFQAQGAAAVVAAVITDPPRPLQDLRPELPRKLVAVVYKALAKDPAERYARVEDLAAALAPFAELEAGSPSLESPPAQDSASPLGDSGRAAWIAAAVISVLIGALALFFRLKGAPHRPVSAESDRPASSAVAAATLSSQEAPQQASASAPPEPPLLAPSAAVTTALTSSASTSSPSRRPPATPPRTRPDVRNNPLHL